MRTFWSSSALFLLSYILDAVLGLKTHSDVEGRSVGMVMQSTPLYGQSKKK